MINNFKDLDDNKKDYCSKLIHPYFTKEIYENLKQTEQLQSFIINNSKVNKWLIFSDYCLDDQNKPNNVMTFSIFAFEKGANLEQIAKILNQLQKKDSKNTTIINLNYLKFISNLPIFNISLLLPVNRNFMKAFNFDEINFLKMRYESLENYYTQIQNFPIKDNDFSDYIKDLRYIQSKFQSKSISLKIFRDIEIITSTITSIFSLISTIHSSKELEFVWVSDRDSLLTFEKGKLSTPLIFTIINANFNSFLPTKNKIIFYKHQEDHKPEFDHFNRIPDIIAGTLADMTTKEVSKEKFLTVLKNYLVIKNKNHIAKIHFDENNYGISSISIHKD